MSTDSPTPEESAGADAPEVEAPAVEAPATEAPAPEAPAVEASADAPEVEAPAIEAAEGSVADGLTIGSEAEGEEAAEVIERPDPVIRGKLDKFGVAWGTGRRKTSVARVRVKDGSGEFSVNGRPIDEYFTNERDREMIMRPLNATEATGSVDITIRVNGGGTTGQTGAVILGIARALQVRNPSLHSALSEGGWLTRDGRMVERKKYGFKKARKSFQFSKR